MNVNREGRDGIHKLSPTVCLLKIDLVISLLVTTRNESLGVEIRSVSLLPLKLNGGGPFRFLLDVYVSFRKQLLSDKFTKIKRRAILICRVKELNPYRY